MYLYYNTVSKASVGVLFFLINMLYRYICTRSIFALILAREPNAEHSSQITITGCIIYHQSIIRIIRLFT